MVHSHDALLPLLQEHLNDQEGEILPHLLIADFERWAEAQVSGDRAGVAVLLSLLEEEYRRGDPEIQELISVSFLELLPSREEAGEIWELMGPDLTAEADLHRR